MSAHDEGRDILLMYDYDIGLTVLTYDIGKKGKKHQKYIVPFLPASRRIQLPCIISLAYWTRR